MNRRAVLLVAGAVVVATTALAFSGSVRLGIVMIAAWLFVGLNAAWAWGLVEGLRGGRFRG